MLKIEPYDYEIELEEAKAGLQIARRDLLAEQGKQRWAKSVERDSRTKSSGSAKDLRLRVPHVKAAEARMASAQKVLEEAERNLKRTVLKAPMNMVVLNEDIEVGRYITLRTNVGKAVGTDLFWVKVALPLSRVTMVDIPGVNAKEGSKVKVLLKNSRGEGIERMGQVVKLMPDLEQDGRLARLLVEVKDPLGIKSKKRVYPLLINSFVRVIIEGREFKDIVKLPRAALRHGDELWLAVPGLDKDGKEEYRLQIKKADVIWRMPGSVLIGEALQQNELLVTSYLSTPIDGMRLMIDEPKKMIEKAATAEAEVKAEGEGEGEVKAVEVKHDAK